MSIQDKVSQAIGVFDEVAGDCPTAGEAEDHADAAISMVFSDTDPGKAVGAAYIRAYADLRVATTPETRAAYTAARKAVYA